MKFTLAVLAAFIGATYALPTSLHADARPIARTSVEQAYSNGNVVSEDGLIREGPWAKREEASEQLVGRTSLEKFYTEGSWGGRRDGVPQGKA